MPKTNEYNETMNEVNETMNTVMTFNFCENSVRTIEIDGEPWFVGKDVAKALGYTGVEKAIRVHVDEEDKGVSILDTPGGKQEIVRINESGVYSLIFSSKQERAKEFKRWVTKEVLPAIRKTGSYSTGNNTQAENEAMKVCMTLADAFTQYTISLNECISESKKQREVTERVERNCLGVNEVISNSYRDLRDSLEEKNECISSLRAEVDKLKEAIENPAPRRRRRREKTNKEEKVRLTTITVIARKYGMNAIGLNKFLEEKGVQYKNAEGVWTLTDQYKDKDYTRLTNFLNHQTRETGQFAKWTPAGVEFIDSLMKANQK